MTTATVNYESSNVASYIAGEALEANRLVMLDSTEGQVVYPTAITDVVIGVTLEKVASGEQVSVQTGGVAKIATTAVAIALKAQVMASTATPGSCLLAAGATARSIGICESASGGTLGELIKVRLGTPNLNGAANS